MLNKCFKRAKSTASRTVDNEAVVVIPEGGLVRVLNDAGSRVWQLLDGEHTVKEIVEAISQEFDAPAEQTQTDIMSFIKELEAKQMVEGL